MAPLHNSFMNSHFFAVPQFPGDPQGTVPYAWPGNSGSPQGTTVPEHPRSSRFVFRELRRRVLFSRTASSRLAFRELRRRVLLFANCVVAFCFSRTASSRFAFRELRRRVLFFANCVVALCFSRTRRVLAKNTRKTHEKSI